MLGQEPHRLELEAIFNQMIQRLGEVVPDLGRDTAGDSRSLKARLLRCDRPKTAGELGTQAEPAPAGPAGDKPDKIELICNAGKDYGFTVRVKQEIDLRRFPPIPRATKQFERLYKGRTSVERVNGRLNIFWGLDDGNITGATRFHALVGMVMIVHAAFATLLAAAPRREGTLGKMWLSAIAKALHERIAASAGQTSARSTKPKTRRASGAKQRRFFAA